MNDSYINVKAALETFTPPPVLDDLTQLPKVNKKMIREARKQATEREVRRKKMNSTPQRRRERDALLKGYNSLAAQRQR